MAKEFSSLDFGITGTHMGDISAAEDFLSDGVIETDDIEEIKEEPKKEEKEKKEVKEEEHDPLNSDFLDEKEEVDEEDPKEVKEEVKDKDFNPFSSIAKELFDTGALSLEEDEEVPTISTAEELHDRFNKEGELRATTWLENYLSQFGEDRRNMFQAIFVNGTDPKEYLPVYNNITDYSQLDMADERNQEKVVKEYYSRLNWQEDKIDLKVKKLKEYGDLEEEAGNLHDLVIKQDEKSLLDLEEKKKQQLAIMQRDDEQYKSSIGKILNEGFKSKQIDGIPISEKTRNETFDFMYTKKYKTSDGKLLTEMDKFWAELKRPENHLQLAKFALLAQQKFDLAKVKTTAISQTSNKLFKELASQTTKTKKEAVSTNHKSSIWDSL